MSSTTLQREQYSTGFLMRRGKVGEACSVHILVTSTQVLATSFSTQKLNMSLVEFGSPPLGVPSLGSTANPTRNSFELSSGPQTASGRARKGSSRRRTKGFTFTNTTLYVYTKLFADVTTTTVTFLVNRTTCTASSSTTIDGSRTRICTKRFHRS